MTMNKEQVKDMFELALWSYSCIQGGALEAPSWVQEGLQGLIIDGAYDWSMFPIVILDTGLRVQVQGDLGSQGTRINVGLQREGGKEIWLDIGHNYP